MTSFVYLIPHAGKRRLASCPSEPLASSAAASHGQWCWSWPHAPAHRTLL